jgi:hypothetical protein
MVQDGKLEIGKPRLTYGYLGAPRPLTGALPGDIVHYTFEIKNLKFDDAGKAAYSIAIEIRDEKGKLIFEQKPYNSVAQNFLGGNSLPCAAQLEIPLDAKPGPMAWKITVTDRTTKEAVTLAGKGKVLPADFGIVQVGMFGDPDARAPTSAVGVVGDALYLRFALTGFGRDKDKKQPDTHVSMRILDEQGKPTMKKPLQGALQSGVAADASFLPMQFGLTLNRPGNFTIELTAEDRVTGKTSKVDYKLRVLPLAP